MTEWPNAVVLKPIEPRGSEGLFSEAMPQAHASLRTLK